MYKTSIELIQVNRGIKQVNRFLLFKINGIKKIALITTPPLLHRKKPTYFVYETDQNTFDVNDGKILDNDLGKDWLKYLVKHPEQQFLTKPALKDELISVESVDIHYKTSNVLPFNLKPHHVIEDIERTLLDGQVLKQLFANLGRSSMMDFGLGLLAGVGLGIVLLMVMGAIFPDQVSVIVGGQ